MDSILGTIKKMVGPSEDYDYFDTDLIIHINSIFAVLHQLGVGPAEPYKITGPENTWSEFLEDKKQLEDVKLYIYLRTRLIFDTPSNSFVVNAFENQIREIEWRLHIADDNISDLTKGKGAGGSGDCDCSFATDEQVDAVINKIFGD